MSLGEYLKISGESVKTFSSRASIPWETVRGYLYRGLTPSPRRIQVIAEATGGLVSLTDWVSG